MPLWLPIPGGTQESNPTLHPAPSPVWQHPCNPHPKSNFTSPRPLVYRNGNMKKASVRLLLPLLALSTLFAGCTSTTITNLTPSRYPKNPNGLYPFHVEWRSNQQSLRKESLKPYVVIGMESYPMQPTPLLKNRWETLIPVPSDKPVVNYRFKFDYEYKSIPVRRPNSKLSQPYQLQIQGQ